MFQVSSEDMNCYVGEEDEHVRLYNIYLILFLRSFFIFSLEDLDV